MAYSVNMKNAAPRVYYDGIRDMSARQLPAPTGTRAQFIPLFIIKAAKGKMGRTVIGPGMDAKKIYGIETFDEGGDYHNHQTEAALEALSRGNTVVINRVQSPNAKDVANVTLYLDVLETQVPVYEKEDDGSIKYDASGEPVTVKGSDGNDKMIDGFKVLWVAEGTENDVGDYLIGTNKVRTGIQTANGVDSKQYPIVEFSYADISKYGNEMAVSISAFTERDRTSFPSGILTEGNIYPYSFSLHTTVDKVTGQTAPVLNLFGSERTTFSFAKGARDVRTNRLIDLEAVIEDEYLNVDPTVKSDLGGVYVYHDNYNELVKKFYEAETANLDDFSDFSLIPGEENYDAINIASFVNSTNSPYQAIKLVDEVGSVRLTRSTEHFFEGGDDGEITDEFYEGYIRAQMKEYLNPLSMLRSFEVAPETDFFDTGFTLETKLELANFIAGRYDTFVTWSTVIDGVDLTLEEQTAIAASLDTVIRLTPESQVHGTGACRAVILSGSGRITGRNYRERVPLTYHLLSKAARYMGDSSGRWRENYLFDRAPGSIIDTMHDIDIKWVPASTRNVLWDASLNFPMIYEGDTFFLPAIKTVYKDDTSVLNSYFNVKAATNLVRVMHAVWKEFSGSISLTNAQLIERVNSSIIERTHNIYDGLYRVVPETTITELDELRGYSWTTVVKLYANNMKTVMHAIIETHRFEN